MGRIGWRDSQEGANHDSPCWLGRRPAWMAKPYSRDLRERMVRAVQAGRSRHEVARIFEVSASCVIKLMHRYEATGDLCAGQVRRTQAVRIDRFRRQGAGVGGRTARCDRHGALAKADGARHQGGTLGGRALLATPAADLQKNGLGSAARLWRWKRVALS